MVPTGVRPVPLRSCAPRARGDGFPLPLPERGGECAPRACGVGPHCRHAEQACFSSNWENLAVPDSSSEETADLPAHAGLEVFNGVVFEGGLPGDRLLARLSGTTRTVWAKYDPRTDGSLPLWRHMADAAAVAGLLWDHWVPAQVRRTIGAALPGGAGDARRLVVWLAAIHDIGKASPAFACQVESLAGAMRDVGLGMPAHPQMPDRRLAPHGLAGQALLEEWLVERCGWTRRSVLQFGIVVGGHHGVPPGYHDIRELNVHPDLLRTPGFESQWRDVQTELLDACAEVCGVAERLAEWRQVRLPQPVQVLLTGLVIVADWIASNPDLFPYFPEGQHHSDAER
ncbi:MAG TPA: CRISPR-associated endonuclease Cas3'', partial [Mycobacteriales bacterium]